MLSRYRPIGYIGGYFNLFGNFITNKLYFAVGFGQILHWIIIYITTIKLKSPNYLFVVIYDEEMIKPIAWS